MLVRFFQQVVKTLGYLLLLVPVLLLGWLFWEAPQVAEAAEVLSIGSNTGRRRKPWSAEARFFLLIFVVLLVVGGLSWLGWRHFHA